jgi:MFS family permease
VSLSGHRAAHADAYSEPILPRRPEGALDGVPLLQQSRFLRFALSTLTSSTAGNALTYTLLIVVISEKESGIFASLFVLCSLLPVIVFGLFAGVVVDHLPNKLFLVVANLVRAGAVALLLIEPTNVWAILAFLALFWAVREFSSPASSSALPTLLPQHRYSTGGALLDVVNLVAQLIGLVLFAPIVLKVAGPEPIYAVAAGLYMLAAYFVFSIPNLTGQKMGRLEIRVERRLAQLAEELSAGWRMLRSDPIAFQAMVEYTLLGTGTAILVVLAPDYTEEVAKTAAENLVFIFSPAAAGLFLGLWLAPVLGRAWSNSASASVGFAIFVGAIAGFALSGFLGAAIKENGFVPVERIADFFNIGITVAVTMVLAVPAGVGAGIVGISAKAALLERAPAEFRGRVFSTGSWASGVLSIIPIFAAGLIAEAVDVRVAIVLLAVALTGAAVYARLGVKAEPQTRIAVGS